MSSGRYHHHVGSNVWHSAAREARRRARGLSWFAFEAADAAQRDTVIQRLKAANAPLSEGAERPRNARSVRNRVRFTG
jgi:catechol 2,3-dioxygenase